MVIHIVTEPHGMPHDILHSNLPLTFEKIMEESVVSLSLSLILGQSLNDDISLFPSFLTAP